VPRLELAHLIVSAVAPFVAAGAALVGIAFQRRERVACVITYGMTHDHQGRPEEAAFLTVHNLSNQTIAVSRVRYLRGIPRSPNEGTALDYSDPFDLNFPYMVAPGDIRRLQLDDTQALRLAEKVSGVPAFAARLLRRHRIKVELTTTTGLRQSIGGEGVLSWNDRAPWLRNA